jgi:Flp pilus assembly protein TadD
MLRLFLIVALFLSASAPQGLAQVSQEPHDQVLRSDPPEARQSFDDHTQGVTQRRSDAQARTRAHDSRVDLAKPPWEYTSPEDADILEGWDSRPPAAAATSPSEASGSGLSALAHAWQLYRHGNYAAAATAFAPLTASDNRQEALNARLGLAYSLIKQGRIDQAISHLTHLVGQEYRLSETRLALAHALTQRGRWAAARMQVAQLPPGQRVIMEKRLLEARLLKEYQSLDLKAGPQALSLFLDSHAQALAECVRPDVFHSIAKRLTEAGAPQQATELRRRLLGCPLPSDLRLGIIAELMNSLPDEEALSLLHKERPGLRQAAAELDALELQILKLQMARQVKDSDGKARLAEEILKLTPADPDALSALAWYRFKRGEYAEAEHLFVRLTQKDPGNKDYVIGLAYARLNSGKLDTALDPLERGLIAEDAETRSLRQQVYRKQAAEAYDSGHFDQASFPLENLLALDPTDEDAKELLAWTRYRQGRRDEARTLMEESFSAKPRPSLAAGLLGIYTASGDEERAYRVADRLAGDPDPGIRASAGPFFFDRGAPITAAQLDRDPERCFRNADSPRVESFLYHRSKQGAGKFGDLEETSLPTTFVFSTAVGNQWSAAVTPRYLSGNSGPSAPQAGRYYRFLDGGAKNQDLEDSLFVVQPDVGFAMEGALHTDIHIGTTPLNGPVDPTPTFEARVSALDWFVDVHRRNVKDSILSFVGQKDPYGKDEWGRVTRNGLEAGGTWPLGGKWWASGSAGFDYYMGESVWDNQAVHLDAAVGRTLLFDRDELSYGLFATVQHFRRNSDFYTYGHGGYYSPELMTMVGPFVRYRTAICRDYWFDVHASAGWLHQRLDSSPFYPLFDGDTAGFTPAAAADANGRYDSDTDNKLGFNIQVQGMKLITPHLAAGGFASVNNSADYTEWTAGIGIQIFFDSQNLFWTRKDMFSEFGKSSNK